jgi:hypothetical protein
LLFAWPLGAAAQLPPTPIYRFGFDASHANRRIEEKITIPEDRSYIFGIEFEYANLIDLKRVARLVGIDKGNSGISVPIHLAISNADSPNTIIYDGVILTNGYLYHGFSKSGRGGNFRRKIKIIQLPRGSYRIEANTLQSAPEFMGTTSYFVVDYDPIAKFLHDQ